MSRIALRVIPNASKSKIVGREGDIWKVRLAASPIDGKANHELICFLANILDLAPSEIALRKGFGSKQKILDIPLSPAEIESRFNSL